MASPTSIEPPLIAGNRPLRRRGRWPVMRALTAWDGLDAAAHRARELEAELRAARRRTVSVVELAGLRLAYLAALGEAVIWTRRIMDAASARGEACPFCREVTP